MEAAALLALNGEAGDEVGGIDEVAELTDVLACLYALKKVLRLFVEHVEAVPGTLQS